MNCENAVSVKLPARSVNTDKMEVTIVMYNIADECYTLLVSDGNPIKPSKSMEFNSEQDLRREMINISDCWSHLLS